MALKAGPKQAVTSKLPVCDTAIEFIELVTGQPLYQWQREVLTDLSGTERPRLAYVQIGRKQGKTRMGAGLMLWEACDLSRPGRHIFAISDSERNLNSTLMREIRDIIQQSPLLRDCIHVFKNHIEVPETGSTIETRASNFQASQGINPHLVVMDEVHLQPNDEIWTGMKMAGAARKDPLLLGLTTPGLDLTSLAHNLYQQAKADNSRLYSRIYEPADLNCDTDDREAWAQANPTLGEGDEIAALTLEGLVDDRETIPEHHFRRFRLGLWTATNEAWLPYGKWDERALSHPRELEPGEKIWLGFDGSYSGDSTALVAVTEDLHCVVLGLWENPGSKGWRVPRADVEDAIALAFATYDVQEMLVDKPYWERELAEWTARWPNQVFDFPTGSRQRMAPACTALYAGVMEGRLTHNGDPALARHLANAVVRHSQYGDVITKPDPDSPAKIDAAVALCVAYMRAATNQKPARAKLFVGVAGAA